MAEALQTCITSAGKVAAALAPLQTAASKTAAHSSEQTQAAGAPRLQRREVKLKGGGCYGSKQRLQLRSEKA